MMMIITKVINLMKIKMKKSTMKKIQILIKTFLIELGHIDLELNLYHY
jgi:hypothetical protein